MVTVSDGFVRRMVDVYGAEGAAWIERLPAIVAECEQRWLLQACPSFEPLSYNYVAPVVLADGAAAVLKVGFPGPELLLEIEALRIFDGDGYVRLIESDAGLGAMLLERLTPGTPLSSVEDDVRATAIAAGVMRDHRNPIPPGSHFPTVADWTKGIARLRLRFEGGTGPLPPRLVEQAERLFVEFIPSSAEPVLLHGDLHHDNILMAERRPWLAIDPKGLVGEPAYEMGALLRNPRPLIASEQHLDRLMARRVAQLSDELGFDRQRVTGWGIAQAVLSACWSVEDHGHGWELAIACAEALAALID
jgi:streptomycin 6-kinase